MEQEAINRKHKVKNNPVGDVYRVAYMVPRNYYQLQQMKIQNMKREYLRNITEKKGKFESRYKRVLVFVNLCKLNLTY